MKEREIYINKGDVNILRPRCLPRVIRLQKHKSKRTCTYATLNLQLWMWLVDLHYSFECDRLTELSDNKLSNNKQSNNKLSDNNLGSELVKKYAVF